MIKPELISLIGDRIDREVAMSRRDKEIETEAARQAHYIQWGLIMGISDPCGHQRVYWVPHVRSKFQEQRFSEIKYH